MPHKMMVFGLMLVTTDRAKKKLNCARFGLIAFQWFSFVSCKFRHTNYFLNFLFRSILLNCTFTYFCCISLITTFVQHHTTHTFDSITFFLFWISFFDFNWVHAYAIRIYSRIQYCWTDNGNVWKASLEIVKYLIAHTNMPIFFFIAGGISLCWCRFLYWCVIVHRLLLSTAWRTIDHWID